MRSEGIVNLKLLKIDSNSLRWCDADNGCACDCCHRYNENKAGPGNLLKSSALGNGPIMFGITVAPGETVEVYSSEHISSIKWSEDL